MLNLVIASLFLVGGILIFIINRKKTGQEQKAAWLKYGVYFIIVELIVQCLQLQAQFFFVLAIIIATASFVEIVRLVYGPTPFEASIWTMLIFVLLAAPFIGFAFMDAKLVLFTYLVVSIFDGFSQISGQLLGRNKLVPKISPNKTVEGFIGGLVFASLLGGFLHQISAYSFGKALLIAFLISVFAFLGDLLESYCKRSFGIKDFGKMIPGHGGFLDRFDSFIVAGSAVFLLNKLSLI